MSRSASFLALFVLGFFVGACGARDSAMPQPGTDPEGGVGLDAGVGLDSGGGLEAGADLDVRAEDSAQGLAVDASFSSATLGDEGCDAGAATPRTDASV